MVDTFLVFMIFMISFTAIFRDRFAFTILYFFAAAYIVGRWWIYKAISQLVFRRKFDRYAFLGEYVDVEIDIQNQGWLPVPWVQIQDFIPLEVADERVFRRVISLKSQERQFLNYRLYTHKRGYYALGPLSIVSGDLLGLVGEVKREGKVDYLTVFPKVIPFSFVALPSHSPIGTIKHTQPVFEDPARPVGKREYITGDSIRRIDWKATASTGRIQIKQYEPSIDLQVAILLNLNMGDYFPKTWFDSTEIAIITAASIANWAATQKLATSLSVNGSDPLSEQQISTSIQPGKGRSHLIHILAVLARIQAAEVNSFTSFIQSATLHLGWGTTIVIITGIANNTLLDELYRNRRNGLNVILILCGSNPHLREIVTQAGFYGIPVYPFEREKDLEVWRSRL